TPTCPDDYVAAFVAGTEPRETCDQQSGVAGFFSRIFNGAPKPLPPPNSPEAANSQDSQDQNQQKKKGFFGKLAGPLQNDKPSNPPPKPPDNNNNADPH